MKRSVDCGRLAIILSIGLLLTACVSYYRVTDPQSGKEFLTQKVETLQGGAVKLKDARTGSVVTLQNSQVKEISSNEYNAGLATPAAIPSAGPAAAPAPTAAPVEAPAATPTEAGQAK